MNFRSLVFFLFFFFAKHNFLPKKKTTWKGVKSFKVVRCCWYYDWSICGQRRVHPLSLRLRDNKSRNRQIVIKTKQGKIRNHQNASTKICSNDDIQFDAIKISLLKRSESVIMSTPFTGDSVKFIFNFGILQIPSAFRCYHWKSPVRENERVIISNGTGLLKANRYDYIPNLVLILFLRPEKAWQTTLHEPSNIWNSKFFCHLSV